MPQMAKRPENASEFEAALLARRKAIFESEVLMHLNSAFTLARYLTRRGDVAENLFRKPFCAPTAVSMKRAAVTFGLGFSPSSEIAF